jgi:uncharacterized protein with PIN domain
MRRQGAKDPEVITVCNKRDYHVLTHDTVGFRGLTPKIKIGIIFIGSRDPDRWLPKFVKLLNKLPRHRDLYYKTIHISNSINIMDRKTGEVKIL